MNFPMTPDTENGFRRLVGPVFAPQDDNDGADAFFANLEPEAAAEEAGTTVPDDTTPAPKDDADPKAKTGFDDGVEDEPEDDEAPSDDPDDVEVDLGDNAKAKMRDLKDAYKVRETARTNAEEAATARATAQHSNLIARAAIDKALERAKARWEPYANLDFLELSRDESISQADFAAIRKEASEALQDYRFVSEELNGVVKQQSEAQAAATHATAQKTIAALSNPDTGIKGWGQPLYNELVGFAVKSGAPKAAAEGLVDEWAFRALHKAYLYDQGIAQAREKIEKVVHKPHRVLQSATGTKAAPTSSYKSAMSKLSKTGDVDDAADAFFATMGDE